MSFIFWLIADTPAATFVSQCYASYNWSVSHLLILLCVKKELCCFFLCIS